MNHYPAVCQPSEPKKPCAELSAAMILARNNIIVPIKNAAGTEYAILNPVSGSFDMMDASDSALLRDIENGKDVDPTFSSYLLERGYAYRCAEDEIKALDAAYSAFKKEIENTQVRLVLIPACSRNPAYPYCDRHGIEAEHNVIAKEAVDAFFIYAKNTFSDRPKKPFITLFGCEPLLNSPKRRAILDTIVGRCAEEGYELAAVTNGSDFAAFADILKQAKIKQIQFALDASPETANNKGSFDAVAAGIGEAVKNRIPVSLRAVADPGDLRELVRLAEYLDSKGWLDLPPELFETQLGRSCGLIDCRFSPGHLTTQAGLWAEYSALSKEHPILQKFHRPDFQGIRHMVDTGELSMASFDTCPAAKTEWVFDLNGGIYGCMAGCGRREYLLGTFYPEVTPDLPAVQKWRKRSVRTIEQCKSCAYDVICGGGCGIAAADKNGGDPLAPDCRPIRELLETGVNHYIDDIRRMTDELDAAGAGQAENRAVDSCCAPEPRAETSSCCAPGQKTRGCVVCGGELVYAETPRTHTCLVCKGEFQTHVACPNGHFICDVCHGADILGQVKRLLMPSANADPVALLLEVFRLPGLKMHGPEYHSIVPAVLVAAYQNAAGVRDEAMLDEAIRRGRDIKGGSCGYHGICGAAAGTGIAASVLEKATPLSDGERGGVMVVTGRTLIDLSRHGGPRCCKRDSVSSVESFVRYTDYFGGVETAEYVCSQFPGNRECIGVKCPYFPAGR